MSTAADRVAVELEVMDRVLRELRRLNSTDRGRAMRWVDAKIADRPAPSINDPEPLPVKKESVGIYVQGIHEQPVGDSREVTVTFVVTDPWSRAQLYTALHRAAATESGWDVSVVPTVTPQNLRGEP